MLRIDALLLLFCNIFLNIYLVYLSFFYHNLFVLEIVIHFLHYFLYVFEFFLIILILFFDGTELISILVLLIFFIFLFDLYSSSKTNIKIFMDFTFLNK